MLTVLTIIKTTTKFMVLLEYKRIAKRSFFFCVRYIATLHGGGNIRFEEI
jgi:hypothetical protein